VVIVSTVAATEVYAVVAASTSAAAAITRPAEAEVRPVTAAPVVSLTLNRKMIPVWVST